MYNSLTLIIDPFILFSAHMRSWLLKLEQKKFLYILVLGLYVIINAAVLSLFTSFIHFIAISIITGQVLNEPFELFLNFFSLSLVMQFFLIVALKRRTQTPYPELAMKVIWLFELVHKRSYVYRYTMIFCFVYFIIALILIKPFTIESYPMLSGFIITFLPFLIATLVLYFVPRKGLKLSIYRLIFHLVASFIMFYFGLLVLINKSELVEIYVGYSLLCFSLINTIVQLILRTNNIYKLYINEQHKIIETKLHILDAKCNAQLLINIYRSIRVGLYLIQKRKKALQFTVILCLAAVFIGLIYFVLTKLQGIDIQIEPFFNRLSSPEKAQTITGVILFTFISTGFVLNFIFRAKKRKLVDYLLLFTRVSFFNSVSLLMASTLNEIPYNSIPFKLGFAFFLLFISIGLVLLALSKIGSYIMNNKPNDRESNKE